MPNNTLSLPVLAAVPQLLAALRHGNAVLQAPPGAGKSTAIPLALWESGQFTGKLLMLEPRRIAARSVALRMAQTLNEPVGNTVGYRTRLDTQVSERTRIEVVTEGILTRMLQHDAALEGVSIVIFDEFHERSLQADLGLALSLDTQAALRDDLKLLVMSATLDGAAVAKLLGDAPIITSAGQAYPVTTHYRTRSTATTPRDIDLARDVSHVILRTLDAEPGDVLVFLPGQGEIRRTQQLLHDAQLPNTVHVLPLYGELSPQEQDFAIQPSRPGQRKVVLATNLAETSLTIEGVRVVIDSGLVRRSRFDPVTGMNSLELLRISRASADQRRGRAGRTQAGVCYRLWLESEHDLLAAHTPAEILESDLLTLALELACWGSSDATQLRWLDVPPMAHLNQARELLSDLGALDPHGRITPHGRAMAKLGLAPRLAHMLLKAQDWQLLDLAIDVAAVLSERDLLRSRGRAQDRDVDLRTRIEALYGHGIAHHDIDQSAKQRMRRSAEQWRRILRHRDTQHALQQLDQLGVLLALAYPDRIAQKRGSDDARYLLSNGRGATLQSPQTLSNSEYLVVTQLDGAERDARIQLAAPISAEELRTRFAALIETRERIEWHSRDAAVVAVRETKLHALTLDSKRIDAADPALLLEALLIGVRAVGLQALPWSAAAQTLRTRLMFAAHHDQQPTTPWPKVDDATLLATLEDWLAPWLNGLTRLTQLQQLDLHEILLGLLDWNQQQRLNDIAPTHLSVPSGSRIPLDYSHDTPTLSVRLQEVFGMKQTPRVGGVAVLMELLSPARRPVQVTQDLASFWARGYHDVKKDLKGRYPKHYWPDDPLQAEATARAKPRGT